MQLLKTPNIFLLSSLFALMACNDDAVMTPDTLSGNGEKTPLAVTVLLDAGSKTSQTRAADKDFAAGDEMVAYIRHVTWNGGFTSADADKRDVIAADQAPLLVNLKCTGNQAWNSTLNDIFPFLPDTVCQIFGTGDNPDTRQAAGLTLTYSKGGSTIEGLYWDDLSNSASTDTDIRTEGHYLQTYYGYCYNGGTKNITTALSEVTGELGWKVLTDQSTPTNFQKSDLLWSAEQKPIRYGHSDERAGVRDSLIIPYTHAMSKVTIKVTAGEGFESNYDFKTGEANTNVELRDIRLKCTAVAPKDSLIYPAKTVDGAKGDVKMKPDTGEGTRSFEAIIVPSILTVGNNFATITNMDGNTYNIPVTEAMVKYDKNAPSSKGWGLQLDNAKEDVDNGVAQKPATTNGTIPVGEGFQMRSGVHYVLNVTVNKTGINVAATILDWDEVEAEGVGEIYFDNDIKANKDKDTITAMLQTHGFDVYMKDSDANSYGSRATHLRYNKTSGVWKYDPVIYWQGGKAQDFRALSNVRPDAEDTGANESLTMENGRDALWGTTLKADGYEEGQAVKPRTGAVPLKFYHAMSKITFYLEDALKGNGGLAEIDLHDATIQLTNLATGGTLNLGTGEITPSAVVEKTFSEDQGAVPARMGYFAAKENKVVTSYDEEYTLKEYIITPQEIGDAALVIVTLADGTVYKGQLNKCTTEVTENGVTTKKPISEWKRCVHYTYTITLGKETITFRALIENWNDVEGGGKATLEWD